MFAKMHRFLGLSPPPSKKSRLEESKRIYEEKRTRKFIPEWKKEFPWVVIEISGGQDGTEKMFCKLCRKIEKTGTFVTGNSTFRKDNLRSHARSKSHIKYAAMELAKQQKIGSSVAEETLMKLNKQVWDRLSKLFRIAHALAKHGRPFSDFSWMCQLADDLGTDLGKTYRNDKRAQEFIHFITVDKMVSLAENVSDAKFLSIITDGSTDSSRQESEILYVRYSVNGVIDTKFIGIKNVGKPDAATIVSAITSILTERFGSSWRSKLVSAGTDGAKVMTGKNTGVVKRLSDEVQRPVLGVHCSAHRLELAYKDACSKSKMYEKVSSLMLNLYYFYRNSPLNRHNLKMAFEPFKRRPRIPSRVGGTRWLPHVLKALETIVYGLGPIVTHLKQIIEGGQDKTEKGAKARNFLRQLEKKETVTFIHFLLDCVSTLSKTSLKFQDRATTVADIHQELECSKAILETYRDRDGPRLSSISQVDGYDELKGDLGNFPSNRVKIVDNLKASLTSRFDASADVMRAMSLVNLSSWPATKKQLDEDPDFGNSHVGMLAGDDVLGEHLQAAGTDTQTLVDEWIRFKSLAYTRFEKIPLSWERLSSLRSDCPSILDLIDCILSIPASSAEAERGFSYMKIVKSDWRSRLTDSHLTDLLAIQMEGDSDSSYQPDNAIHQWFSKSARSRRPNFAETTACAASQVMVPMDIVQDILEDSAAEDLYSDEETPDIDKILEEEKAYSLLQSYE